MVESVLSLEGFGVAFNERIVLSSITFDIPETGIVTLLGPSGAGKSTLLRAITGLTQSNPAHRIWGKAMYVGTELFSAALRPALVLQNVRLLMSSVLENIVFELPERATLTLPRQRELAKRLLVQAGLDDLVDQLNTKVTDLPLADQRQLAILRLAAANPRLLCIDEPSADLDEAGKKRMFDYIKKEAEKRAVLIVTHDRGWARDLGGYSVLMAGGWVQEMQAAEDFFTAPLTDAGKSFIRTGSCALPSPGAKPEDVAPEWVAAIRKPPKAATNYKSHVLGPNGFMWLKKGRLAGTPRPGLLVDMDLDLTALKRVGVTHLLSLTIRPIDEAKCAEFDIGVLRYPIPDMHAPPMEMALKICQEVAELLDADQVVAAHCRAGLGRTGTLLAAQLIYEGESALAALEQARRIESRWVQSEIQVDFLEEFEQFLKAK